MEASYANKMAPVMPRQDQCPAIDDLTALLIEHGPTAMASALATLMNRAMQVERACAPGRVSSASVQKLCGLDITSTQVTRAAAELDEQLSA